LNPFLFLAVATLVFTEPSPTIEWNPPEAASDAFQFSSIPAPSAVDAANDAVVSQLASTSSSGSGGLKALTDGVVQFDDDEPEASFFLRPSVRSDRILFEFPGPIPIQAIQSYSWHSNERAPQVYKVYGDGGQKELPASKESKEDLAGLGWTLIASVDTRSKDHETGGQYAARIAAAEGKDLGQHQRLIFDISRTNEDDRFSQTFFSEIDVLDGHDRPAAKPSGPKRDVLDVPGGYRIAFEAEETPELQGWIESTLKPVCAEWYPKIIEKLPSDGFHPPKQFRIRFEKDMDGVAYYDGRGVHCAGKWFEQNRNGEGPGAVVHEMVHVVQQYHRAKGNENNPGWLVEGLADQIRWFQYEPENKRPRKPNPKKAKYTDAYQVTAGFLNWLVENGHPDLIRQLNTIMREGKYSDSTWNDVAGKSVDDLWDEYVKTL
jgi:hypothetical protein